MNKKEIYEQLLKQIDAVLKDEKNTVSKMSTICGILKESFSYYYWVGFYIEDNGVLKIGPYQGTLACITIDFDKGVCGRAFRLAETQIVKDTHQDPEHIACDPKSNSEIVIPVINKHHKVFAVLDVDSTIYEAFDEVDAYYLEILVKTYFSF